MGYYDGGWPAYVSVAERRKQAEKRAAKLRKAGQALQPVSVAGSKIATTFWGQAWCTNLESYKDYENRLGRGRSYVRNGCVVHLQIEAGRITAMVSGSDMYTVSITIKQAEKPHWKSICADCAGGIDSLVELLAGRLSKPVMARLCRQDNGLFPRPEEIKFKCSCPDWADMCKHVAAVCYGVGARLDEQPELLFRLRGVDEADLIAHIDTAGPLSKQAPGAGRVLDVDDVSALFGLEMEAGADAMQSVIPPVRAVKKPAKKVPAVGKVAVTRAARAAKAKVAVATRRAPVKAGK
jgi:uncharacterized Zn finger protein